MNKLMIAAVAGAIAFGIDSIQAGEFSPTVVAEQSGGWELVPIAGSSDFCYVFRSAATLTIPADCLADVLVVGGGGGGGRGCYGGGGGAGGLIYRCNFLLGAGDYAIVVGTGGGAQQNGGNSSFGELEAIGGGKGGSGLINTPAVRAVRAAARTIVRLAVRGRMDRATTAAPPATFPRAAVVAAQVRRDRRRMAKMAARAVTA